MNSTNLCNSLSLANSGVSGINSNAANLQLKQKDLHTQPNSKQRLLLCKQQNNNSVKSKSHVSATQGYFTSVVRPYLNAPLLPTPVCRPIPSFAQHCFVLPRFNNCFNKGTPIMPASTFSTSSGCQISKTPLPLASNNFIGFQWIVKVKCMEDVRRLRLPMVFFPKGLCDNFKMNSAKSINECIKCIQSDESCSIYKNEFILLSSLDPSILNFSIKSEEKTNTPTPQSFSPNNKVGGGIYAYQFNMNENFLINENDPLTISCKKESIFKMKNDQLEDTNKNSYNDLNSNSNHEKCSIFLPLINYSNLKKYVCQLYRINHRGSKVLKYLDDEGELCTLTEETLRDAQILAALSVYNNNSKNDHSYSNNNKAYCYLNVSDFQSSSNNDSMNKMHEKSSIISIENINQKIEKSPLLPNLSKEKIDKGKRKADLEQVDNKSLSKSKCEPNFDHNISNCDSSRKGEISLKNKNEEKCHQTKNKKKRKRKSQKKKKSKEKNSPIPCKCYYATLNLQLYLEESFSKKINNYLEKQKKLIDFCCNENSSLPKDSLFLQQIFNLIRNVNQSSAENLLNNISNKATNDISNFVNSNVEKDMKTLLDNDLAFRVKNNLNIGVNDHASSSDFTQVPNMDITNNEVFEAHCNNNTNFINFALNDSNSGVYAQTEESNNANQAEKDGGEQSKERKETNSLVNFENIQKKDVLCNNMVSEKLCIMGNNNDNYNNNSNSNANNNETESNNNNITTISDKTISSNHHCLSSNNNKTLNTICNCDDNYFTVIRKNTDCCNSNRNYNSDCNYLTGSCIAANQENCQKKINKTTKLKVKGKNKLNTNRNKFFIITNDKHSFIFKKKKESKQDEKEILSTNKNTNPHMNIDENCSSYITDETKKDLKSNNSESIIIKNEETKEIIEQDYAEYEYVSFLSENEFLVNEESYCEII